MEQDQQIAELLRMHDEMSGKAPEGSSPAVEELFHRISEAKASLATGKDRKQAPSQEIYPTPAFVIKTTDDTGRKVFVNVCGSDAIAAPAAWENGSIPLEAQEALRNLDEASGSAAEALRIPLSLSEKRLDIDKHGESCSVFDCVFGSQVISEAVRLRPVKHFLIELAISWIDHKHKLGLDQQYKLPKLKYKGEKIQSHRIRIDSKRLITEVGETTVEEAPALPLRVQPGSRPPAASLSDSGSVGSIRQMGQQQEANGKAGPARSGELLSGPSAPGKIAAGTGESTLQASVAEVLDVQYVGSPCAGLVLTLRLDEACRRGGEVTVTAQLDCVHLTAPQLAPVAVPLNVYVDSSSVECSLAGLELMVSLRYLPMTEVLERMEATRPLEAGTLQLKTDGIMNELG